MIMAESVYGVYDDLLAALKHAHRLSRKYNKHFVIAQTKPGSNIFKVIAADKRWAATAASHVRSPICKKSNLDKGCRDDSSRLYVGPGVLCIIEQIKVMKREAADGVSRVEIDDDFGSVKEASFETE